MMLKDYRELAASLKDKFQSISKWPEIDLNSDDKKLLSELEIVSSVNNHSIQINIDSNHTIIPSQYILYAICIKELALALKDHIDVFESLKKGKSQNDIGEALTSGNFDLNNLQLDAFSQKIALLPFINDEYKLGAKSIVNGNPGSYKIRGVSDFYASVLLKTINVPDASSAMLGKFIFTLAEKPELYSYLERRFLNHIPYLIKEKKINKFVKGTISFLIDYDGFDKFQSLLIKNTEPTLYSIKQEGINLTSIFKISDKLLSADNLSQGGRLRFFENPITLNSHNEFVYLSTEWTDGTESRLDLKSFVACLKGIYSEFDITQENETYILKINNSITKQINVIEKLHETDSIRDFALFVFQHFYAGKWKSIIELSERKSSTINDDSYTILDYDVFKRLIGEFDGERTSEQLKSSNTIRFFDTPIFKENGKVYYFTTQWNGGGEANNNFQELKKYFESKFQDYTLENTDTKYKLIYMPNTQSKFNIKGFRDSLKECGLTFSDSLVTRFVTSLMAKQFLILTGLSGSGKTKLAQAFVKWISYNENQFRIIPVGADWTNREPLLGYPNALISGKYILPESGALNILLEANKEENKDKPYFLILDEMNLSHVERYFADFLSTMESSEEIPLRPDVKWEDAVPSKTKIPSNLFIIGTVNIDETTYMFSPKVLDRANVIEFRVTSKEMGDYLGNNISLALDKLDAMGAPISNDFVGVSRNRDLASTNNTEIKKALMNFFDELKKTGAEFGYRSATEILRLSAIIQNSEPTWTEQQIIDIAVMQKLLPKVHGSRRKLEPVLQTLASLCVKKDIRNQRDFKIEALLIADNSEETSTKLDLPISFEKIKRMYKGLLDNGFTSYAEA